MLLANVKSPAANTDQSVMCIWDGWAFVWQQGLRNRSCWQHVGAELKAWEKGLDHGGRLRGHHGLLLQPLVGWEGRFTAWPEDERFICYAGVHGQKSFHTDITPRVRCWIIQWRFWSGKASTDWFLQKELWLRLLKRPCLAVTERYNFIIFYLETSKQLTLSLVPVPYRHSPVCFI